MLKVNKKVEYALMALKFMNDKGGNSLTSAREVCDKFNTPFDTTAKVMQAMNNNDILNSVKGIKGGYSLAKPIQKITYMDLVNIVESKGPQSICQSAKGLCELYGHCNIATPMENLSRKINDYLSKLTLDQLFSSTCFPHFDKHQGLKESSHHE